VNVAGVGMLAGSGASDLVIELIRFLLSEEGQRYFAESTFEYPLAANVPPADGLPTLDELQAPSIDLSDLDSIAATQELLADVGLLTR